MCIHNVSSQARDWQIDVNTHHEKRRLSEICPWAQAY